jgi:anti-anti-sigma factor
MTSDDQHANAMSAPPAGQALFILVGRDGVLSATGGLDARTAPALRRVLQTRPAKASGRRLLDLRGLTYVDADGMAVLCDYANRLHFVVQPCSPVAAVVHTYGLDSPVRGALTAVL